MSFRMLSRIFVRSIRSLFLSKKKSKDERAPKLYYLIERRVSGSAVLSSMLGLMPRHHRAAFKDGGLARDDPQRSFVTSEFFQKTNALCSMMRGV